MRKLLLASIRDGARRGVHRTGICCNGGQLQVLRLLPYSRNRRQQRRQERRCGRQRPGLRRLDPGPASRPRPTKAKSGPCGKSTGMRPLMWTRPRPRMTRTRTSYSAAPGGRVGVGTNRWVVDFAVPGSALRARWGRTDYTSPDNEIFDSAGNSRDPGVALYGKLSKNMSLSMFMTRSGISEWP